MSTGLENKKGHHLDQFPWHSIVGSQLVWRINGEQQTIPKLVEEEKNKREKAKINEIKHSFFYEWSTKWEVASSKRLIELISP